MKHGQSIFEEESVTN